jgi:hypothetical protein
MIEILAILEAEIRRIVTWGQPGQIVHELPSPKQPKKKKWTGSMGQTVEHLFCKLKTLSSNSNSQKKEGKLRVVFPIHSPTVPSHGQTLGLEIQAGLDRLS